MARRLRFALPISCLFLLASCGQPSGTSGGSSAGATVATTANATLAQTDINAPERATAVTAASASASASAPSPTAQKLVRSGELGIDVEDVQNAMHSADSLIRLHGALLADSKVDRNIDGHRQAELTIRVPSDSFARTIVVLRQLGDVREEAVKTQDVTREYIDLTTRLAVKEQEVARLRTLLDTRAAKLTDVLDVERELTRAVTELEEMKGEQHYYDQQVALSSIQLTLTERTASGSTQVTSPLRDALRSSLSVLGTSLSGIIYLIAIVLPWAIIVLIVWWVATRVRNRARSSGR